MEGMLGVLAEDITLWADGGGKVPGAALRPIHGPDAVARFVADRAQRFAPAERTWRPAQINGQPGLIVYVSGRPLTAMIFHVRDGRIGTIYAVGNPEKLRGLAEPS
jgi:RNA polymerase sigma-70 factor (ECF subfamily)